jgi:hypothetical protein
MFKPEGWISESPSKERFADFVDEAVQKTRQAAKPRGSIQETS